MGKEFSVYIDGDYFVADQSPFIEEGRVLIPMRAFFEALGARVGWNSQTRTVFAIKDGSMVVIPIGSWFPMVGGATVEIDVPARIVGGRTFAPLRFVGESLGESVRWDRPSQSVYVDVLPT